ncbi:MAG TPA: hypothetical protein VFT55_03795 [Planctomycetota bacterium]|nr:hypothetical protein [Planctomycetota bacterium]
MKSILLPVTLVLAATLSAQNCPERNLGINLGVGDDTVFAMQAIGFAFPFAGTTYSNVHICANGYVTLSNGGVPAPGVGDYSATAVELASGPPRIAALWHDLNLTAANGAGAYINSSPTKCTITWDRAVNYGHTATFQIQLQLSPTGEAEVFYSKGVTNNSTFNYLAGIGITGVSPGLGAILPAASDLSAGGVTLDNMLYEVWPLTTTFDMPFRNLELVPVSPAGWVFQSVAWNGCALATDYGTGCISARDSFYEVMPIGGFDLSNTTMTLLRSPNGYIATNSIPGVIVPPSPSAAIIANLDDTTQVVALSSPMPVAGGGSTSSLNVSSNGNIALAAATNGGGFAPEAGLFLAFVQTSVAACWHDYNPAAPGSGKIRYEEVGGISYVTWDNVYTYQTTAGDTFQYQFERATGNVTIVYGTITPTSLPGANNYLVGYSVGGVSWRPEASDLSVDLGLGLQVVDVAVQGITLTSSSLPLLNTTYTLNTSAVPPVLPVAFLFFGDTQINPGIDLGFIGAPDCRAYTNANLTSITFPVTLPAGTGSFGLFIPNVPGLVGLTLSCQSIALSLATPLNLVFSNGNSFTCGL